MWVWKNFCFCGSWNCWLSPQRPRSEPVKLLEHVYMCCLTDFPALKTERFFFTVASKLVSWSVTEEVSDSLISSVMFTEGWQFMKAYSNMDTFVCLNFLLMFAFCPSFAGTWFHETQTGKIAVFDPINRWGKVWTRRKSPMAFLACEEMTKNDVSTNDRSDSDVAK